MMRAIVPVCFVLVLAAATACGSASIEATEGSPTPSPTVSQTPAATAVPGTGDPTAAVTSPAVPAVPSRPVAPLGKITVTKSGGMVGVQQTLQIEPDGSWVFIDKRAFGDSRGNLTAPQNQELARLTAGAAFAAEAKLAPAPGACNDSFVYTIAVGDLSVRHDECAGAVKRPITDQVVALLTGATPL